MSMISNMVAITDELDKMSYELLSIYLGYKVDQSNICVAYRELISRGVKLEIDSSLPVIHHNPTSVVDSFGTIVTTLKIVPISEIRFMTYAERTHLQQLSYGVYDKEQFMGKRPDQVIIDDVMGDM